MPESYLEKYQFYNGGKVIRPSFGYEGRQHAGIQLDRPFTFFVRPHDAGSTFDPIRQGQLHGS